jgi:hypothetical protein
MASFLLPAIVHGTAAVASTKGTALAYTYPQDFRRQVIGTQFACLITHAGSWEFCCPGTCLHAYTQGANRQPCVGMLLQILGSWCRDVW